MITPLTFGVELEFAAASLESWQIPSDHLERRTLHFEDPNKPRFKARRNCDSPTTWQRVAQHIVKTLNRAGHNARFDPDDGTTALPKVFDAWEVTEDGSIYKPDEANELAEYQRYKWHPIEVRSPALYFTKESLRAVQDVCSILSSTYCLNTNLTTGLHIHVGDGVKGFTFDTMRKLTAFLYAFEPQINSLHPESRIENIYCHPFRGKSQLCVNWKRENKSVITPREAVASLLRAETMGSLCKMLYTHGFTAAYQFVNIESVLAGFSCHSKPTIEFRQHAGTLDSDAVINWVKTVVGIMTYIREADDHDFFQLLATIDFEHWATLGDGCDAEREEKLGPILADKDFTIVDLLKHIGVFSAALYYQNRGIYKHTKGSPTVQYIDMLDVPIPKSLHVRRGTSIAKLETGLTERMGEVSLRSTDDRKTSLDNAISNLEGEIQKDLKQLIRTPPRFYESRFSMDGSFNIDSMRFDQQLDSWGDTFVSPIPERVLIPFSTIDWNPSLSRSRPVTPEVGPKTVMVAPEHVPLPKSPSSPTEKGEDGGRKGSNSGAVALNF